jgi:sugar phosphate isomerase/epimerase
MRYAMKAAAASAAQLQDRVVRLRRLGLPIVVELHTTHETLDDSRAVIRCRRLVDEEAARLTIHAPFQAPDPAGRIDLDEDAVRRSAEFAEAVGAKALVLHRVSASRMNGSAAERTSREAETIRFNERIVVIAAEFPALRFLARTSGSCG